jgi:peptidoglycan hydrolase CwlO-like protein
MFKKIAVFGAAGLLTAAVLTQTKLGTYLSTYIDRAERHIDSKIPPEKELARIKSEIGKLDKDINLAMGDLATENVEVRELKKEIGELRAKVDGSRKALDERAKMLKDASDNKLVKWDSREISLGDAKDRLAREVKAQKNLETLHKNKETMLSVRERTRKHSEDHLTALVSQKTELDAAILEMEADLKLAKVEQVESKYQNDGSRMAEVKQSMAKLKKRIEVQREKLSLSKKISPDSVDNKSVDEIMAELDTKADAVGLNK